MNNDVELLSPAGDFEKMQYALRYGADAVYLSGMSFGMRSACANFSLDELKSAVVYAHNLGKKLYLTVNIMPHPDEIPELEEYIESLTDIGIDAFIVADLGVMKLIQKYIPGAEIHISTQMSCTNAYSAEFLHSVGAKRVVLARELSLDEIAKIRASVSKELELEVFIHGSMCMAYSGRCFLSNNLTGRDANRGKCAQPCRWNYKVVESNRPDDHIDIEQGDNGTLFFSSKDLCMIEHIPELVESGIKSFKIEGRVKSAYYTAVTANSYRIAIDSYLSDKENYRYNPALYDELCSVSHREYATGFFYDNPSDKPQNVSMDGYIREKGFLATVEAFDESTMTATLMQRNKMCSFTDAYLLTPGKLTQKIKIGQLYDMDSNPIESAPHPKMLYKVKCDIPMKVGDIIRG